MLCSRLLHSAHQQRHGRLYAASEAFFEGMKHIYDSSLKWTLRHQRFTIAVFAGIVIVTGWLFVIMPKGFLPNEDTGQLFVFTEAAQDVSFEAMAKQQQAVANIIRADPNVASLMSFIGASGSSQSLNLGRIFIRLKPRGQRLSADEIIQELRPKVETLPGIKVYLQNLPTIRIGGMLTKSQYQYTLQDADTETLYHWAPLIEAKIKQMPGFRDVTSDLQISNPQVMVDIDRDKASALGVTLQQIESALYDAYGSRQVSTIYTPSNEYWVIMELEPKYQRDAQALSMLYVRASSGTLVPLSSVARLRPGVGTLTINHLGQLPAVTISFDLQAGVSLSDALRRIEKVKSELGAPATLSASFQGAAQAFQASLQNMGYLLAMSILVIYLVLGILYESFVHPVTILSGLPTAGLGALITLLLFHYDLDMYAFVGIIM
ncbi:MAG: efflux RND transporter permease subunit, partial [Burkholderiales bacterium]